MKLESVRVQNFRNIIDSGVTSVDPDMTCLVGKNEAGKSAMLEAIHSLNPLKPAMSLQYARDYPQWLWKKHEREGQLGASPVVVATYAVDEMTRDEGESTFGPGTVPAEIEVSRWYPREDAQLTFRVNADATAFLAWFAEEHDLAGAPPTSIRELREHLNQLGTDESPHPASDALKALLGNQSLNQAVGRWLLQRIPKTLYFSNYAQLKGEYLLSDVFDQVESPKDDADDSLKTAADFLHLAQVDREGAEADDYVHMKAELRAVSNDLTREMREFWTQNQHLSLMVDIDKRERKVNNQEQVIDRHLRFEVDDTSHLFQTNLERRSTGFRWFVSFMAAFFEHRDDTNVILLFDEPGLSLHARAQTDLLEAIEQRVADSRQTLYTTHSPFMVRPKALEQVRIVEDHEPNNGAVKVSDRIAATDPDTLFPLQAALGYDLAANLFVGPHNVIVEGISDYIYLNYFRHRLEAEGPAPLRSSASILPTRSVTKIPTFLSLLGNQLDLVVVVDGDAPDQKLQQCIDEGLVRGEAVICLGRYALKGRRDADIEDLFDTSNYLRIFNDLYGTHYSPGDISDGNRIVKMIETVHQSFNHGEVASFFLANSDRLAPNATTAGRFMALLADIDAALPNR